MSDILEILGITPDEQPTKPKAKAAKPKADSESPSYEDAARALAEALDQDTGRRKSLSHWKKTVSEALGISRLYKKRYDAVLAKGEELGLFEVDRDTGSYPFLVRLEPKPEPEPEIIIEPGEPPAPPPEPWEPPPLPDPDSWNPPMPMDCGHMNWWADEENESARAEGFCCMGGKKKWPVNYRHMKGEFRKPVPQSRRRTKEKAEGTGFPGLCCDEDGYYIGGTFNDCQREGKLCTYHKLADPRTGRVREVVYDNDD